MWNCITGCFGEYSTPKQVKIQSKLLAVTNMGIILLVGICYFVSLDFDVTKIYQKSCPAKGGMVLKVKGNLSTEGIPDSEFQVPNPQLYKRVWDASDLIFPPYGSDGHQVDSFVAVSNLIITPNQTRGVCPDSSLSCETDEDCPRNGRCDNGSRTCLVSAWCPMEKSILPLRGKRPLLEGIQEFTLLIKNSVEFPECEGSIKTRNIMDNATRRYLSSCRYDKENDTLCPIFRLGDMVRWSGSNFTRVAVTGGIFRIEAHWECDFDWFWSEKLCFPKYIFERTDNEDAISSPGWNFRETLYHEEHRRTLRKMYGLKILVVTTGYGKEFDFLQLILTLGATIGLFAIAPLVSDYLFEFLCWLKKYPPFHKWFGDFSVKSKYQEADKFIGSLFTVNSREEEEMPRPRMNIGDNAAFQ